MGVREAAVGKTFSEKILGRKAGQDVQAGEVVTVSPDYVLSHDNSAAIIKEFQKLGVASVRAPEKIVIVLDHIVPAADEKYAQNHKTIREFVAAQGIRNFFDINAGVCHQVLPEQGFALPGPASSSAAIRTRRPTERSAPSPPASDGPRPPASGRPTRSGSASRRPCASTSPGGCGRGVFAKDAQPQAHRRPRRRDGQLQGRRVRRARSRATSASARG